LILQNFDTSKRIRSQDHY